MSIKKLMRLVHERGVSLNLPHEREELKKADISVCPKYISRSLTMLHLLYQQIPSCLPYQQIHHPGKSSLSYLYTRHKVM